MQLHDFQFFTLEILVIQFFILGVILWVLNKFIFKPYLAYLDTETEKRQKLENDYKNIEKLLKDAEEKRESILDDARSRAGTIISDAESLARKQTSNILQKADEDAKSLLNSAKNELEKEKQTMLNSMKERVLDLALSLNQKLFDKERVNRDFIDKELTQIK